MRVAVDINGQRIYASEEAKKTECFCQSCGEKVRPRVGKIKIPHFAHMPQSECSYGKDKDSKSEWHIRMQDYFPIEAQEVRFEDEKTNEVHIADVFLKDANIVIEFQHSPITPEEFCSRTAFHINAGRRIAWIFDESSSVEGQIGRFKVDELAMANYPYTTMKWMRSPRKCLNFGPDLNRYNDRYSICVYVGNGDDIINRIVREYYGFESVDFSFHPIRMQKGMNVEELFVPDTVWEKMEPYKTVFDRYKEEQRRKRLAQHSATVYPIRQVHSRRSFCF